MAQPQGRNVGSRPQDFTGRKKEELAKEHAAEVSARASELSMIESEAEILDSQVIDTTIKDEPAPPAGPTELLEVDGAEIARDASRVIQIREDCDPTIGAGNHYKFEAMKKYRVPTNVADHLEEKGLVYH